MPTARAVTVLAFAGAQTLDFAGPLETLAVAERLRPGSYARSLVTPDGAPFATGSGLRVTPDGALGDVGGLDTLIVAGGFGVQQLLETSGTAVDLIARSCGFGTPETLRRSFGRRLGVSPGQYRDRFNAHPEEAA